MDSKLNMKLLVYCLRPPNRGLFYRKVFLEDFIAKFH